MADKQEPVFTPKSGYESFIYIYNKTAVDFSLNKSKAEVGSWAKESPPNQIKAGTIGLAQLNDTDTLLIFFPGHVNVYLAGASASNAVDIMDSSVEELATEAIPRAKGTARIAYEIGFHGPGGLKIRDPVHEDMAIAAFIKSKMRFPKGTEYNNLDAAQWEYMRGLLWSDDPLCLLFKDSRESNSELALGAEFLADFLAGSPSSLTQRSHFGDLQFLHAMAPQANEDPQDTKKSMLSWLETIYKLSIGVQGVTETDGLGDRFPNRFSSSSNPSGDANLRQMFLGSTPSYFKANISKRAIGHCLHMVQDSFAVGHTLRRLSNPSDLDGKDGEGYFRFKPGKFARLGPIITFHTYSGQSSRHARYDESKQLRSPRDLDSFNHIIGARDAIDKSTKLINFYAQKTKWEDGVRDFFANEVFELDSSATSSNPQVDERFGSPDTSNQSTLEADRLADEEYQLGMGRKMAMLESGLAFSGRVPSKPRFRCLSQLSCRCTSAVLMFLKLLVGFIVIAGATILFRGFRLA
ncbi:hypothetical protein CABS01_00663 [Colletotrichum abscissum]|uniref:uncharacterized protein n=1 Tax=Colletotrichum abscissum TaxID=1671311 RepID=UPI0027D532B7|nr:uncharacterized protein CABS01_00663 [Colletotrichum abscissum]KAK1525574.1 hypothetical protein CABS01_00663 [Colletotrichum abscissum]